MDSYHIVELIKFLQTEPTVNQDDLLRVECAYLHLLHHDNDANPTLIESRLAADPNFFCKLIQFFYLSQNERRPTREQSEASQAAIINFLQLLDEWKIPPGTQDDGTFNEEHFKEWLQRVKKICTESGHLKAALVHIGRVLIHAPADPHGLWIHHVAAAALNDCEAEDMRSGFGTGIYKRGVPEVDSSGKPEIELAKKFRTKAEQVENEGFQRFAASLRGVADNYDREAKRIIDEYDQNTHE